MRRKPNGPDVPVVGANSLNLSLSPNIIKHDGRLLISGHEMRSRPVGSTHTEPMGDLAVDEVALVSGDIMLTHPRLLKSHNLMVLSCEPLANIAPPQLYNDKIGAECPERDWKGVPVTQSVT